MTAKVQIAYIHGANVSHSFHHSLMRLANADQNGLFMPDTVSALSDALSIPESRNALMQYFLDETDATHIWWIDTDMGFAVDTVHNLLETGKDVVGAVCKAVQYTEKDGFGGYVTKPYVTAYDLAKFTVPADEDNEEQEIIGFVLKQELDLDSPDLIPVAGTGTACLLISRHAATQVRAFYGNSWFERVAMPLGRRHLKPGIIGEDLSFCYRLATVGIPVFIHPKVITTHAKIVWVQ